MSRRDVEIVAAIIRRGDELLLVRQAGPDEEPFWSIPGGRVEPGESPEAALRREVREETGLGVLGAPSLAYEASVVAGREQARYAVSAWEIDAWEGELAPNDPDGFVLDVAWVPLADAIERLARVSWLAELVAHLRRRPGPGGTAQPPAV